MDSFNDYKLKPKTHTIQPNDIIIRVKDGTTVAPIGTIGIVLEDYYLSLNHNNRWLNNYYEDWRAIETKPGSEAVVGDTVYCIEDTGGDCKPHDLFIVNDITVFKSSKFLGPHKGHTLLNKKITEKDWKWSSNDFVVLTKADSVSEFPSNQEVFAASFIPFTIVDIRGKERTCIGLSEDNWYVSKNHNGNSVRHNPLFWTKKEELKGNIEIENVTSFISLDTITTVSADSIINKPTQTKPNTKGKQMNSSLFTDMLKLLTQVEQTDLQKAPSTYAFFYNEEGEYEGTAKVTNEDEAKALLQRPEHLGYTMRIYSFSDEFTTQIPVVSTIRKTVASKPAIKPRKPRAPKSN